MRQVIFPRKGESGLSQVLLCCVVCHLHCLTTFLISSSVHMCVHVYTHCSIVHIHIYMNTMCIAH